MGDRIKSTFRTIAARFSHLKMKEYILEEVKKKNPKDIWIYQKFLEETVKIRKGMWGNVKEFKSQSNCMFF